MEEEAEEEVNKRKAEGRQPRARSVGRAEPHGGPSVAGCRVHVESVGWALVGEKPPGDQRPEEGGAPTQDSSWGQGP